MLTPISNYHHSKLPPIGAIVVVEGTHTIDPNKMDRGIVFAVLFLRHPHR